MFSRDNFSFSNQTQTQTQSQTYTEAYNSTFVNSNGIFNDSAPMRYSPVLDNSFITPPMNSLPYYDIPVSTVNYMDWGSFLPNSPSPRVSEYLKPELSPSRGDFTHDQSQPDYSQSHTQDANYFFPTINNLTGDNNNDPFPSHYSTKSINTDFIGSFPRLPRLQSSYTNFPPRSLGLPATTQLAPGVNVPRRKPTLLSRDPTQPILYCKFCLQPFSRRNSLRRHEQLHTGIKPYMCHPCGRSFSRQDIFKRHCASRRCMRLTQEESWNNSH